LAATLEGAPAGVVYNTNEVGFDEWVDVKKVHVIVRASYSEETISISVSRRDAHASMITCITADGHSLKPVLVMPRKTAEIKLFEVGFTPGNCTLLYQESGFWRAALFGRWCLEVFLPDIVERRIILGYEGIIFLVLD
jgi:hypothetical protein